ncbi:MAG: pirin-like C-terminal cupin domain-containing protein, partial [Rubrivivax sp.]|nr:pirin-like C-terminal cupin domain-containing protein [Rubrivivax sp.]
CAPAYRDISPDQIPTLTQPGVSVRVIAGSSHGVAGAVQRDGTEPLLLDIRLEPGARFEQPLPAAHNGFVHVYRGELSVGDTLVRQRRMAILAQHAGSDGVRLQAGTDGARALLVAGRPLGEPIAQYGPFVMNSDAEIFQAVEDFRAGRLA